MDFLLHDTLQRQTKVVRPSDGTTLRFYCCGPTVYGPAHIGNFRTFVLHDVFRRVAEAQGMATRHVRNVTDVDDKTIRGSLAAGQSLTEFTRRWLRTFHADCDALQCLRPHVEPSAVDHIPHQVRMIVELMDKGHAYQAADGSVYFKISSFAEYGRLSHLDTRELKLGASVAADEYDDKEGLADFALWKARKPEDGENHWPSPWGEGRPGWHLECSAMAREYLGETFDLHSGGVDLIFPHHENEIAQSQCCTGHAMCHHWFHITHLLVDSAKMSKSLGNLYTLEDLRAKGHSAAAVRYTLMGAHYRQSLNFTLDSLGAAQSALTKLAKAEKSLAGSLPAAAAVPEAVGPFESAWHALLDDLNTPKAFGQIFTTLAKAPSSPEEAAAQLGGLRWIIRVLGLELPSLDIAEVAIPPDVQALAERRWAARTAKDWAQADLLRQELTAHGWVMKDGKEDFSLSPL
jgi:cysteinyl-tRNA synthetase